MFLSQTIQQIFQAQFGYAPTLFEAPGRINLIGEHTDYNEGFVLPAAVDKKMVVAMGKNNLVNTCRLFAADKQESFEFSLSDITPTHGGWQNYILGVAAEFQKMGASLTGFDCVFGGNVPIGAGMSSSAALECGVAVGLNTVFDLGFAPMEMVKAAQLAEHHFAGVKCGIMDQFASMMGRDNAAILLDCRSLAYQYFPLNLEQYSLLLCNTNVSHALADSAYNIRRAQCEEGVLFFKKNHPQIRSLRDLTLPLLKKYQHALPTTIFQKCAYVVQENERVQAACAALQQDDLHTLGNMMYASHKGLSEQYEVSCKELDFLVAQTVDKPYILGARMMGGGFGGCTINLIESAKIEEFVATLAPQYEQTMDRQMTHYIVKLGNGAGELET